MTRGFRRISSRLFFSFLLMALLTVSLIWLIQAGLLRDSYVKSKIRTVENALDNFSNSSIADIEEQTASSLLIFDQKGEISYRAQGLPMMGMMQRKTQSMLPLTSTKTDFVSADHIGIRYAVIGTPTQDGSTVFAVFSLADADEASRLLRQQLWLITIVLILLAGVISAWLAKRLADPVQAVTRAANQIEMGNYDVRLEVKSTDELGKLTSSLNSMSAQLRKNDQLQKELIANVSHELKAPLTIIRGYAETIRDVTWSDDAKRNASLDLIIDESERLRSIVQDILDYSQLQAGTIKLKPEPFALRPLLDDVLTKLDQYIRSKNLSVHIEGNDTTIFFDRKRLQQVVLNLIVNAVQYSYDNTEIRISINRHNIVNHSFVKLSISNHGPSIPASDLSSIWDRFHRSNQLRADEPIGTGLGLAIVKSIMDQHGSSCGVSSDEEQTIFWLDLPATSSTSPQG